MSSEPKQISAARLVGMALAASCSIGMLLFGQVWATEVGDASRLAMGLIPWVLAAGWPGPVGTRRDWSLLLGLGLPVWALCAWIDLRLGRGLESLQFVLGAAVWMIICLGESRTLAAKAGLRWYGFLWFFLMLVLPSLAVALAWGQGEALGDGESLQAAGQLSRFSPIQAIWSHASTAGAEMGWTVRLQTPALWACLGLLTLCAVLSSRAPSISSRALPEEGAA